MAKPYPALTIATVLGAPQADAPRLHEWSGWVQRQFDIQALASQVPQMERAVTEVYGVRRGAAGPAAGPSRATTC